MDENGRKCWLFAAPRSKQTTPDCGGGILFVCCNERTILLFITTFPRRSASPRAAKTVDVVFFYKSCACYNILVVITAGYARYYNIALAALSKKARRTLNCCSFFVQLSIFPMPFFRVLDCFVSHNYLSHFLRSGRALICIIVQFCFVCRRISSFKY